MTYTIVGREVGNAKYVLRSTGRIEKHPAWTDSDANPIPPGDHSLDVEFLGRLFTELSNKGGPEKGDAGYDNLCKQIKHAMEARSIKPDAISDIKLKEIWRNTTIELVYDRREPNAKNIVENTRIFSVPAKGTLSAKVAVLGQLGMGQGFPPPLTYELDRKLMILSLIDDLEKAITGYTPTGDAEAWNTERADLLTHVTAALEELASVPVRNTNASIDMQDVLNTPVSAFHRSVGIYITEMCN